jgi:uncharacterized DUF497 family protein
MQQFEWSAVKAALNMDKHGASFDEATTIFGDFGIIYAPDPDHSIGEERELAVGYSLQGRLLTVCFTERKQSISYYLSPCGYIFREKTL